MMTEFDKSNWARPEFSQGYRDNADVFIVERRRMLAILQSFYVHFVKDGSPKTVLDLGCGDGIVASVIAQVDDSLSAVLVDGSRDMIKKARERLHDLKQVSCIQASFQEVVRKDLVHGTADFVASSLAIHHLMMHEKAALFEKIYRLLNRGGYFVNIDVVLAPSWKLEQWYLSLWKEWIDERTWDLGINGNRFESVIDGYKDNKDNKPDTLDSQLDALRSAGFKDVDCYYKNGIFTLFGGRKPAKAT
jgi:tRNA (cmo5U34)-methyltransferase